MDLSTKYLGLKLAHPLVMGASPIVGDLDNVKRVVEAGASAVVMHSLFEEQILLEQKAVDAYITGHENSFAEASGFFPTTEEFGLGPDEYLEQLAKVKAAAGVPVIGSLNGTSNAGWLEYAKRIQQAGADALELNVYYLPTKADETAEQIESRIVEMLATVKKQVTIPVAVKLSQFHTALPHLAARLESAGADGLVVFNRLYQPDIDLENLDVLNKLELSTNTELRLRLRWLAVLSAQRKLSLAVSGGVQSGTDAIKAVMAGAHAVQAVSVVLREGAGWFERTKKQMAQWLEEHEYESLSQSQGSMNLNRAPKSAVYARANYMKVLNSWTESVAVSSAFKR